MDTLAANISKNVEGLDSEVYSRPAAEITINSILLFVILLVTIAGNTIVIIATVRSDVLREQVSSAFIINLSITDLSIGLIVMTTALVAIGSDLHSINKTWCNIVCAGNYCCITVSTLTLVCISVERYIAVLHPLKHSSWLTPGRVQGMIAFTWLQGLVTGCTPVALDWIGYNYSEGICDIQWGLGYRIHFVCVAFVLCFFLPSSIILISYLSIVLDIKKHTADARQVGPADSFPAILPTHLYDKTFIERTKKTVKSLLVLVLVFFACMTPLSLAKLLKVIHVDSVPLRFNMVASYCGYLASAVNPFIYGLFRKNFRKEYKRMAEEIKARFEPFFEVQNLIHPDNKRDRERERQRKFEKFCEDTPVTG